MGLEKFNVGYSTKVIGPYPRNLYIKDLIDRINDVIRRMRFKLIWYKRELEKQNKDKDIQQEDPHESFNDNQREHNDFYGFRTIRHPAKQIEMKPFEDEVLEMVTNIQYKMATNKLQRDVINIRSTLRTSDKIVVESDKTGNHYSMNCDQYDKKLLECITAKYRKEDKGLVHAINLEARELARRLGISDRVPQIGRQEAYITIKDHKDQFPGRVDCRLINPSKSEMGKVSKQILERIVKEVKGKTDSTSG